MSQTDNNKPPIPPRPNHQPLMPQPSMSQRYSPYGPTPFFGPHNPYGIQMISGANQQIDETFQSIQSLVQAFSSISLMLESTYMAVHSSFRAVMDVADHFIRLKDSLSGFMSVMAIFNTIKWFFRRILYMLNLVGEEQIWSDSLTRATEAIKRGQQSITEHGRSQTSSWPMLMFLGVAIGAPYMIYQIQKPAPVSSKWLTQEDCHYVAEALYDFETTHESELPLRAGQKVIIAPKEQQPKVADWLLATTDGKRAGLIPMNYVKITKFEIVE
uniref:Peroxisomal membrane protein PEX13 n=1 Tax=Aceria tosichella TaxID=561515 RepID=A0A6G1SA22_9ACAR